MIDVPPLDRRRAAIRSRTPHALGVVTMSRTRTGEGAIAPLAFLVLTPLAAAESQSFSVNVPLQTTSWNQVAPLPRFNPALGTLQWIEVAMDSHIEGTARFENRDPQGATIVTDFSANMRLKRPDNNAVLVNLN